MTNPTLHAQASAVDVASHFVGRSPPKMRPNETEMVERGLKAAYITLLTLAAWRDRLPAEFVAEIDRGLTQ